MEFVLAKIGVNLAEALYFLNNGSRPEALAASPGRSGPRVQRFELALALTQARLPGVETGTADFKGLGRSFGPVLGPKGEDPGSPLRFIGEHIRPPYGIRSESARAADTVPGSDELHGTPWVKESRMYLSLCSEPRRAGLPLS